MPALHFPVLSDLVERGRQLCFSAYLIAGSLYTTCGMVSRTDVKAAKPWQGDAFPSFKALVERLDNAICPGCGCYLIGLHPCSQQANEIFFFEAISHYVPPYKPA